jgi:hypothetical protein
MGERKMTDDYYGVGSSPIWKTPVETGLTLREYFAGLAMQGLLSSFKHDRPGNIERGVRDSVLIADALIAELNKEAVDE